MENSLITLKQFAPESSIPAVTVDLLTSIPESHKSLGLYFPIRWNITDIRLLIRRKA